MEILRTQDKIYNAVDSLKTFPNCQNVKRLTSRNDYRLRVGRYRVIFSVELIIINIEEVKKEMSAHTNVQIIEHNGVPAFAVIPYADYLDLFPQKEDSDYIPHEVVGLMVKKGYNTVKAWRKHLDLTQKEVAKRAGITQSALSQMETSDNEMRTATLEKLAAALGLDVEQLRD